MVRIYRIPTKELEEAFPLAQYCARYWITFAAVAESKDEILQGFIRAFFCYHRSSYRNCYSLYRPDQPAQRGEEPASALYYASFGGLINTVKYLLSQGANVNAQGGEYGNALQAASCGGHDRIVELLLGQGVDVDAQGRVYGNALYAASVGGHDRTVELLLGRAPTSTRKVDGTAMRHRSEATTGSSSCYSARAPTSTHKVDGTATTNDMEMVKTMVEKTVARASLGLVKTSLG
jgi:hypothetical protein